MTKKEKWNIRHGRQMPTKIKEEALLHSNKDLTTWHKKIKIWQDTRRYSTSEDELTYANTWMNSTENNPSNLSKDVLVDFTLILRSTRLRFLVATPTLYKFETPTSARSQAITFTSPASPAGQQQYPSAF